MKYQLRVKATVLTAKERAEQKQGSSICAKVVSLIKHIFTRRK